MQRRGEQKKDQKRRQNRKEQTADTAGILKAVNTA
jgi:hypothetical protein